MSINYEGNIYFTITEKALNEKKFNTFMKKKLIKIIILKLNNIFFYNL